MEAPMTTSGRLSREVPRARDVGLLLVGNALAALHQSGAASPSVLHGLHEWYLCCLCFTDPNNLGAPSPSDDSCDGASSHSFLRIEDVDFHVAAFDASGAGNASTNESRQSRPSTTLPGRASVLPDTATHQTAAAAHPTSLDGGLVVILQLIEKVHSLAGAGLARFVREYLLNALQSTASVSPSSSGLLTLAASLSARHVDISMLSTLFTSVAVEDSALWAVGSATSSYRVWACVAWQGASFPHQTALTALVSSWSAKLRLACDADGRVREDTAAHSSLPRTGTVNLQTAQAMLRRVMEGASTTAVTNDGASIRGLLSDYTSGDNYVAKLLAMQGPGLSCPLARGDLEQQGTVATLFHITTGMLLYAQFHLSLRALSAARQCAQMAVLVGHQIHSDALLALAHYSQFLVSVASGSPSEAADSLSVAMHVSTSSAVRAGQRLGTLTGCAEAAMEGVGLHTGSLCYVGAAQLLLLFPSSVGTPLRSAMTSSALWHAVMRWGRGEDDETQPSREEFVSTLYDPAVTTATAAASQTIAESVQQALWLSEVEALYRPSPGPHWVGLVTRIARETVRLIGAVYGMASVPQCFTQDSIPALLAEMEEELRVSPPVVTLTPQEALLSEMTRHCAYRALVAHEGYLASYPEVRPLAVLRAFREGVRASYGTAGLSCVELDAFFSGVSTYLEAAERARQGYIASAYESLTGLLGHLCHLSGLMQGTTGTSQGGRATAAEAIHTDGSASTASPDARILRSLPDRSPSAGRSSGVYWSPDWLFLLAHVQLQRAELAAYLGHTVCLDEMAASLERVSLQCDFTFGVLSARLIGARALAVRLRFSDARECLMHLDAACTELGLEGLLTKVREQSVCVAVKREAWADTMQMLRQWESNSCPPFSSARQWWALRVRVEVVCRLAETTTTSAQGVPRQLPDASVSVDPLTLSMLHRGLRELGDHPLLHDYSLPTESHASALKESRDMPLTENVAVLTTLLHAKLCAGEEVDSALISRLSALLRLLQERQSDLACNGLAM